MHSAAYCCNILLYRDAYNVVPQVVWKNVWNGLDKRPKITHTHTHTFTSSDTRVYLRVHILLYCVRYSIIICEMKRRHVPSNARHATSEATRRRRPAVILSDTSIGAKKLLVRHADTRAVYAHRARNRIHCTLLLLLLLISWPLYKAGDGSSMCPRDFRGFSSIAFNGLRAV